MYIHSLADQTVCFFMCIGMGFAFGGVYDALRFIRRSFFSSKLSLFVFDILYFVICTVLAFFFLICIDAGKTRGYHLLGLVFGGLTYYLALHSVICRLTDPVSDFLSALFIKIRVFVSSKYRHTVKKAINLLKNIKFKPKDS